MNKSRANSLARQNYDNAYAVLRIWQDYERRADEDPGRVALWRNAWQRNEKYFPARAGHLVEAYFWADHMKGVHNV